MKSLILALLSGLLAMPAAASASEAPLHPQTETTQTEATPASDARRNLTAEQAQALLESLAATKPARIAITANPGSLDAANYALAIAARLGMAGWVIEDSQIRRAVPAGLEAVHGLALVVRDAEAPPAKALQLKNGLAAAKVFPTIVAKPDLAPGAALLWIGKRPQRDAAAIDDATHRRLP